MMAEKSQRAPRILMVSPVPTHHQDAGNRARVFQLAEQFRSLGCDLFLAYCTMERGEFDAMQAYWGRNMVQIPCRSWDGSVFASGRIPRLIQRLQNLAGKWSERKLPKGQGRMDVDAWYDPRMEEVVLELHSRKSFDTVWVEYVFLSKILDRFDVSVRKLIDTHDVFSNRHELLIRQGLEPEWFSTSAEEELKGLRRADAVVAIQDSEAEVFRNLGLPQVVTIGHFPPWQSNLPRKEVTNVLLFAASDNSINVKAWGMFTSKILPLLRKRIPQAKVHVAGKICRRISDSPDYVKLGVVQDLPERYASSRAVINPSPFGTGLNIKTVEPLAFGCPVVTTPSGIRGVEDAEGRGILLGDTPETFLDHIERLFRDQTFHEQQRLLARSYIQDYMKRNRETLSTLIGCSSE